MDHPSVSMFLLPVMSMVCSIEKEGFSVLGKKVGDIKKNLGPSRDYLASPTNCCPPFPGCWPIWLPNKGPKTRGAYWYFDDIPWPCAAWDFMVKKKWTAQTRRLVEDTRGKDHSLRNNWQDCVTFTRLLIWDPQNFLRCSDQNTFYLDRTAWCKMTAMTGLCSVNPEQRAPRAGPSERTIPRRALDKLTSPRSGLLEKNIRTCYFLQISFQVG